ncbi:MAG: hypothetical protein K2H33_07610 [Muribaculaceae bacterium]|nr:hypothetical protein [Muribaculaceae bacterium]
MKKLGLLLIVLTQCLIASADKTEKYVITFSESDFKLSNNSSGYLEIESLNEEYISSYPMGELPGLPLISIDIAVPDSFDIVSSRPTFTRRLIKSNVTLAQTPATTSTDDIPYETLESKPTYDTTKIYPLSNCQYAMSSNWENVLVLHFLVCPFVYDAQKKNLYFIDSFNFEITLTPSCSSSIPNENSEIGSLLKGFVFNKNFVDSLMPNPLYAPKVTDPIDYVIITSQKLKPAFEPLIRWKKTKGLYAKTITVEEIYAKYDGKSNPLKIKQCLKDLYTKNKLKYALLGGDDTVVPTKGCYGAVDKNNDRKNIVSDNKIPTDLYYACLSKGDFDWNGDNDNIYGELSDKINLGQNIYVTRVPVRTAEHVRAFTNKLLNYEKSPKFSNKVLMCGSQLTTETQENKYYHNPKEAETLIDILYNQGGLKKYFERVRFCDTCTDIENPWLNYLDARNLSIQLSQGYNFMTMETHGTQTKWELPYETIGYDTLEAQWPQAPEWKGNGFYTLVVTSACHTNAFDNAKYSADPCLSEGFIRSEFNGIVAYLGSSREAWYKPRNLSKGAAIQYEIQFFKKLLSKDNKEKSFGATVAAAKAAMISLCSKNGTERWTQFALNPIGDPEMPIFIEQPKSFSNVQISYTSGAMKISAGEKGCRICIMSKNDDGKTYYKVFKDKSSVSVTDFPVKTICSICITKPGFIPKILESGFLLQNETFTGSNRYDANHIIMGSSLTKSHASGPVIYQSGNTTLNANKVIIESETKAERTVELIINNK